MGYKTLFKSKIEGQHEIKVQRTSTLRFRVIYGEQIKENLYYDEAAKELGLCIMHRAGCEGFIDEGA